MTGKWSSIAGEWSRRKSEKGRVITTERPGNSLLGAGQRPDVAGEQPGRGRAEAEQRPSRGRGVIDR